MGCDCRPAMDGSGVHHQPDCATRADRDREAERERERLRHDYLKRTEVERAEADERGASPLDKARAVWE